MRRPRRSWPAAARSPGPRTVSTVLVGAVLLATVLVTSGRARPNRYGHSDRVERHMLPAVSTGPLDPAWSPDGRWIAFSMRGDVWKVPADGGRAVALTEGPAYHFEPAWSPDGTRVALSMDVDGNLDIGVVSAEGGPVERITTDAEVDVEPEWSGDGRSLFFVSARDGDFRIYRRGLEGGTPEPVVEGIQPAVSPDGRRLAYVGRVPGRLGAGGLWIKELASPGPGELVQYEETEYRMKPAWSPDGRALLFVTPERGSDDVALVPASGGNPVILTPDGDAEYSPSPSPDGDRFAFVSNHEGPTTLYTVEAGGGPRSSWRPVPIRSRRARRTQTGRIRGRVVGPHGSPVPARIHIEASDGRGYAPDGGYHRVASATETHYFHTGGEFEVEVPAGSTWLEAVRGFEHRPEEATVEVSAGEVAEVELVLERLVDLPSRGWHSGDTHLHDLHQGRFGLSHRDFFEMIAAEDVHVAYSLIHMDGTRLMGRWEDLTGRPHPLSTDTHVLQYAQEFRGSHGHVALLGVERYVMPLIGGSEPTALAQPALDLRYHDAAREQGGIAGFVHPYYAPVEEPSDAAGSLIPLDVALGRGDFYDVAAVPTSEIASAGMYYRLLNAGFRLAATGGTDNFSDVWRGAAPGAARTYARMEGGPSAEGFIEAVRRRRTFATTGPLLFLDVEGREPGEEVALDAGAPDRVRVRLRLESITPVETLEIVANGEVVVSVTPEDPQSAVVEEEIALPEGGWIAARALGPSTRFVTDDFAFAHTSPVDVVRGGRPYASAVDARFLARAVAALGEDVGDEEWRTSEDRERFLAAVAEARSIYERIAREASVGR